MEKKTRIIQLFFCFFVNIISVSVFAQVSHPWEEMGPFGRIPVLAGVPGGSNGIMSNGIVYCVETHPTDLNKLYVGTPGGAWVTLDGGQNWESFATDKEFEHTIAVGSILVDKINPNFVYVATGAKKKSRLHNFYSPEQVTSGVYRCYINGSTKTWTNISSGLPATDGYYASTRNMGYFITEIKQHPGSQDILYIGTTYGLYKTLNATSSNPTWQLVTGVPQLPVYSIEFTRSSTTSVYDCYVSGDNFAVKTNDFNAWTNLIGVGSGLLNVSVYLTDLIALGSTHNPDIIPTAISFYTIFCTPSIKDPNKMYFGLLVAGDAGVSTRYFLSHKNSTGWLQICALVGSATKCHFPSPFNGGYTRQDPIISCAYDPNISDYEKVVMAHEYLDILVETTLNEPYSYSYYKNTNGYHTYGGSQWSHADIRDIVTSIDNRYFYCANDGFLSKFDPYPSGNNYTLHDNWKEMQNNDISLGRSWQVTCADYPNGSDFIGTGTHDNGNFIYKSSIGWKWLGEPGYGDGIDALISGEDYHASNNNNGLSKWVGPALISRVGYPGGLTGYGIGGGDAWQYRRIHKDPKNTNVIYANKGLSLYRITNGNVNSGVEVTNFNALYGMWQSMSALAIAEVNSYDNKRMYVGFSGAPSATEVPYMLTTNHGNAANPTWTFITLPYENAGVATVDSDRLKGIVVSTINPNTVFIAFNSTVNASVNNRARVYKSVNAGAIWEDYNESETTIPKRYRIHCMMYEKGTNDGVYVGTDNGVYYTNANMNNWIRYDVGLPNVPVMDMLYHPIDNKILVATWGRGVWAVRPYCIPNGNITVSPTHWNKPVNATSIYFDWNVPSVPPTQSEYRLALRASNTIEFLPGAHFNANSYPNCSMEAYITPCGTGPSSLRKASKGNTGSREINSFIDVPVFPAKQDDATLETLQKNEIYLYPNPVMNGEINLKLGKYFDQSLEVRITDSKGVVLKSLPNQVGIKELKVDFSPSPGVYLLNVIKNGIPVYTEKIIVPATNEESFEE